MTRNEETNPTTAADVPLYRSVAAAMYRKEMSIPKEDFVDLFVALSVESDRGSVLVAATIIDEALRRLLTDYFKSKSQGTEKDIKFFFTDGPIPPLQSTALKIRLAFALGLIDSGSKNVLTKIQALRSRVAAHSRTPMVLQPEQIEEILKTNPETSVVKRHEFVHETGPSRPFYISQDPSDADGYTPKLMLAAIVVVELESIENSRCSFSDT